MPRVPVYEQQSTLNPLPGVQQSVSGVTPGAFGAGRGEQLSAAGNILSKQAEILQKREDEDLVNQAVTAFEDEQRAFLNDPDGGLLQKRGGNAIGAAETAKTWFDGVKPKFTKALKTDRQRALFEDQYNRSRLSAMTVVSRFEAQERRSSYVNSANARAASAIEQASLYYSQPDVVASARADMAAAVDAVAEAEGYTPEMRQSAHLDASSVFHKRQVEARLEKDPAGAKSYYQNIKSEMRAQDREAIEARIEAGVLRADSQSKTDDIMRQRLPEAEALRLAREIKDPELRDEVVRRVELRYADDRRILKQNQDDALERAYNLHLSGTPTSKMPEKLWSSLNMAGKQALLNLEKAKVAAPIKTDPITWYALEKLRTGSDAERAQFSGLNLLEYADKLSTTDLQALARLQEPMSRQDIDTLATTTQGIKQAMRAVGLDYANLDKKGEDGERARAFHRMVDAEYQTFQANYKRKPSGVELQQILDRASIKIVREINWWPDKEVPLSDITAGELEGIPQRIAIEIADAIKQAGDRVTVQEIKDKYRELRAAGEFPGLPTPGATGDY